MNKKKEKPINQQIESMAEMLANIFIKQVQLGKKSVKNRDKKGKKYESGK